MNASADTQAMFSRIAPRYDLANTVLSMGMDGIWRRRAVNRALGSPGLVVVDLCAGTAKLAIECAMAGRRPARVMAFDFSEPMTALARSASARRGLTGRMDVACADSLAIPLRDESCDVITCGFGVRNLVDLDLGLREMARCLRSGGRLMILEFLKPGTKRVFRFFSWYVQHVLPVIGGWVSGSRDAYAYLPASIERFVTREEFRDRLHAAGFQDVEMSEAMGGVCTAVFATRGPGR
jgi:demethylmenaquinone methyltransferase/2-methoxy-6-polyprenyl-1,4-benzoquinol methylase